MTLIMFCQFYFLAEFCANMQVRYSIFGAHLMQHAKLLMQLCIKDHENLFVALVNRKRVDGSTLRWNNLLFCGSQEPQRGFRDH